ncbi:Uncharacterised protein [Mycobacteroides abscessus subsp. bolletii]|uniref:hypothetical protein n=1 Tax=Mycobacteroides abscessus TaxID=36809 RepID=UPI0009283527|nr:hypothetical protein [Mycobacteroides abscessus]SIJ39964.1 Uncharacterised protein [Mycobacteroides abscessus subsp. bolletii]SLE27825.1 Uncharacterised protein [Mycobacteroides abscessus subsp. bolletii]SLF15078.1 Uncharacterised protein [Mycobacteroides abscessus subsp. bolletii]
MSKQSVWSIDVCRDRVKRAGEIREEIGRVWADHMTAGEQPRQFELARGEVDGQWTLELHTLEPMPIRLSTLFGEWLYLLRSALDGVAHYAAVRDSQQDSPPNESQIYFPIKETAGKFDNDTHRDKLRALSNDTFDWLRGLQPFNSTAGPKSNLLWWINELALSDRHRRGHVLAMHVIPGPVGMNPPLQLGKFHLQADKPMSLEDSGPISILDLQAPVGFGKLQVMQHMDIRHVLGSIVDVTGWRAEATPPMNSYDLGDRMHLCEKHVLTDVIEALVN